MAQNLDEGEASNAVALGTKHSVINNILMQYIFKKIIKINEKILGD